MATFGSIASANPNVLFDPARAIGAAQDQQRNALLMEATQTRMANDVQDRQDAKVQQERLDAGMLADAVRQLPPDQQKAAYESGIALEQRRGRMLNSPTRFEDIGPEGLARAAEMLITPYQRQQIVEKRQASAALMGLLGGAAPAAGVPSVPGAMPVSVPMGPTVRAPAGNPLAGPIPPEMMPVQPGGAIPPPGDPGRNAALLAQRDANLGAGPEHLAAASAARGATGAPQIPGGYRAPDGVAGQYAGLAPPTGVINASVGGAAPAAAPAGPDEGALRAQAAQLRQRALAASTIGSPAAAAAARALEQQATALEGQITDGRRVARDARVDERQANTDARLARAEEARAAAAAAQAKAAQTQQLQTITKDEAPLLERIGGASGVIANGNRLLGLIDQDTVAFGPGAAHIARGANAVGFSTEGTRNFAELERHVAEAVNTVLSQASGPQTDQDAQRARDQILNNLNDKKLVQEGLVALNGVMARAQQIATARAGAAGS
jgi:hypothetical protein